MIIGIVGGLGPETTSEFYLKLIEKSRKHRNSYPHIVIDSIPLEFSVEDDMIIHSRNKRKLLPYLMNSVERLQNTNLIVIPCNTAHIFIKELRKTSRVPVISIVEEVEKKIKHNGYGRVGLLATSSTIESGIYSISGIEFLSPSPDDQKKLSEIIVKIIRNTCTENDRKELERISNRLRQKCDALLLACTDLHILMESDYLDSFDILVDSVFELMGGDKNGTENC